MSAARLLAVAMVCLVGCAHTARIVAPLAYDDSPPPETQASSPASAPVVPRSDESVACPRIEAGVLPNGVQLRVAERHSFPSVVAHLVFPTDLPPDDDMDRIRLGLMGETFLSPRESGVNAQAQCTALGCQVTSGGRREDLDDILLRVARLVVAPTPNEAAYARRLALGVRDLRESSLFSGSKLQRNAFTAAVGDFESVDMRKTEFRLEELGRVRDAVIRPDRAILVVAGDVSFDDVRAAADRLFSAWAAPRVAALEAPTPSPHPAAPQLLLVNHRGLARPLGALVARGPGRGDPDAAALEIAMHLLGGGPTSLAFQAVREEMSAAYAVGGNLVWASRMSLVELQGQFEPDKIVDALGALAASIGRLRGSPPADADVARAKAALIAGIRSRVSTNAGLTAGMIDSIVVGGPPDECAEADAIRSVGATDVQRVVRRYLGNHDVHVVAVGDATTLRGPLEQLGFGAPRLRDGFGRDAN